MNERFRPEPEASAELEDAALWYDEQRQGLGAEFVQAIDVALEQVERWSNIGTLVPGVSGLARQTLAREPLSVSHCLS